MIYRGAAESVELCFRNIKLAESHRSSLEVTLRVFVHI